MKKKTNFIVLLALVVSVIQASSEFEEAAEKLCKDNPKFSGSCKKLLERLKKTEILLKSIKSQGYENWEHLHSNCRKVNYKDIFGICQKLKKNELDLDKLLTKITEKILEISNIKPQNGKGVYNHCKDKINQNKKICKHFVILAQTLKNSKKKNSVKKKGKKKKKKEELLTGTINVICKEKPYLLICKHMVALAEIFEKVEDIKRNVKHEALSRGNSLGEGDMDKIGMFAMKVFDEGREKASLEEFCDGPDEGICEGVEGSGLTDLDGEKTINGIKI